MTSVTPPQSPPSIFTVLLTLAIGTAGGKVFALAHLPLPWLLGAMTATTFAALCGVRLSLPTFLRNSGLAVLGVFLGASYGPESFAQLPEWIPTLLGMCVATALAGALSLFYLRRAGGYDLRTSFFAGMPGGMNEMVIVGQSMGADVRVVALVHAVRVLVTVSFVAGVFRVLDGYVPDPTLLDPAPFVLSQQSMLLAAGIVGAVGGRILRLPAPFFFGPILASLVLHTAGLEGEPPALLRSAAQIAIGAALGARFVGTTRLEISRTLRQGVVTTVIQLCVAFAAALVLAGFLPFEVKTIFLAFAPAGIAEMTITALALGYDATFVAVHHLARVVLVFAVAPGAFRLIRHITSRESRRE
ncbi:MAG: AbrB family transcriptional regulator [Pararhodobacter sp.]